MPSNRLFGVGKWANFFAFSKGRNVSVLFAATEGQQGPAWGSHARSQVRLFQKQGLHTPLSILYVVVGNEPTKKKEKAQKEEKREQEE